MRRRDLFKWSAPILLTTVLPVHAQTSSASLTTVQVGLNTLRTIVFNAQPSTVDAQIISLSTANAAEDGTIINWRIQSSLPGLTFIPTSGTFTVGQDTAVVVQASIDATVTVGDNLSDAYRIHTVQDICNEGICAPASLVVFGQIQLV